MADAAAMDEPVGTPVDDTAAPRRRRWPYLVAKYVAVTLFGLVALVAAVLLGIDTGPGHRLVADQIANLRFASGMRIAVGRIEGSIYGRMVLHDLSIRDPRGEFLYSPQVAVDWRPFAYLRNDIDVRTASAQQLILRRNPAFNQTPPSDAPLLPDLDIDIGHLRVERFIAEPPVSGARRIALLDGAAHIASGRAQVTFTGATLPGQGVGGSGDRVRLRLDAVPAQDRLDIDLALDAPRGGVIVALAGLKAPLTVRLGGAGAWSGWRGHLDADLDGTEFARLQLLATRGTFTVRGPTRAARLVNGATANLLGPRTDIALVAALDQRRAKVTGTVSSDAFTLSSDGVVDLSDNSFDALKLTFQLLKPSAIAPNLAGSGMAALLTLDGAFRTPKVDYLLTADRIVMNGADNSATGLERLVARGNAVVDSEHIVVPVAARVARITGLDTVAGGSLANVSLNGDLAIDGTRVLSDNMRIRSDRIDAKLILVADTAKGLYTGAINGRIDNYRLQSVGVFDINTNLDLRTVPSGGFAMVGKVRVRSTQLFNAGVKSFLGGNAVASTDVRYDTDGGNEGGIVRFANLRLAAPLLRVTSGSGSYAPGGALVLNARAVSTQYGPIGVRVTGTLAAPHAFVTADRPGLGIGLANLDAEVTAVGTAGYRLKARGDTDYGALTADVTLATKGALAVQINDANLGGIAFAGRLQQTRTGPFAGTLTAKGNGLGGVVRLGAQGKYQEALINLRAKDTQLPGKAKLAIGAAIVDARVVLYDKPYVVADAQLSGTQYGGLFINAARVIVDYRGGRGNARALLEGTSGVPFRVAVNADLQPDLWRASLSGRARGLDFRTSSPARIVPRKGGTYQLLPTRVDLGRGNVVLAGTYGAGMTLQARMANVDLALVNAFSPSAGIGGTATGSVDFAQAGAAAFPRAEARLTLSNFTRTTAATVSQPVDLNLVGTLKPEGGDARAVFRVRGAVIGRLAVTLRPEGPGAGSWTDRLMAGTLGGGIRYNGPADTLTSFGGLAGQRLSGPIGVAADFSGRVASPSLAGVVRANALTYENLTYGTRLTNMAIEGKFTGERFQLDRLTATAGNGTIVASGFVSLAADSGYPMDLAVTLDRARLARSDMISASATGKLRLSKAAGETALLSGTLRLPETRYQIVRQAAADVPQLTGVRFKPPRGPRRVTGDEPATPSAGFTGLRLDIALDAPEKLYVSGMGLESEWSAHLKVQGTSSAPQLAGEVDLVRGTLGFAGRSFDIDSGHIAFTGGTAFDPTLAIAASDDIEDVTVNVNVAGTALNPQITFASTPGLPQDEILSRILFGSSVGNLSPLQAVQLASSLNSLRGTGGGLNPLGKLRSVAGIDRLRILGPDEATGRGSAIAAGQYITRNIYVELITDARGFTATQIEVSFTRWLALLGQAGGSGVTNLNLRIKKNY